MSKKKTMGRRQSIKFIAAAGFASFSGALLANNKQSIGAIIPGKGWVEASGEKNEFDGTPLQFMPKTAPDENPVDNDIKKYPRCPYCGMSRQKWNHSRHLVHYDDGLADGTCSIHCLAISLSLNIDRGPKAIYAADFGAQDEVKPLVEVDLATYLVGAKLKGTMTANSKMAFASAEAAKADQAEKGGEIMAFDAALQQAYLDMAKDTNAIRNRRGERRRKMMDKKKMGS